MREKIKTLEKLSITPSFVGTFVLFISLSIIIPPTANILMSAIVSVVAYPLIFVFSLLGCAILIRVNFSKKYQSYMFSISCGVVMGFIGFAIANAIGYFQGTVIAFILSGAVTAISVQHKIIVNKAKQVGTA